MLEDIGDAHPRAVVERVLDAFEQRVAPVWPRLRAQVAHTDLTVDNTLTDETGLITGVIDFGDMSHTALITDLASVLDSLGDGREGPELLRVARLVLDGYQRRVPLEDARARGAGRGVGGAQRDDVAISSWRVAQGLEEQAFAERYNAVSPADARRRWSRPAGTGARAARRTPRRGAPTRRWPARRAAAFGPAIDPLFYAEPIEVARAEGVWITDTAGRRYLDAYNNVPCVGHAHPRVVARDRPPEPPHQHAHALPAPERDRARRAADGDLPAGARHRAARQLRARRPTISRGGWRPRSPAARGGMCTAFAYHGITEATAALSPEGWFDDARARARRVWEAPDAFGGDLDGAIRGGLERWGSAGPPRDPRRPDHQRRHRRPRPRLRPGPVRQTHARAACGSPTRCSPATAAPATRCGASSAPASSPTS